MQNTVWEMDRSQGLELCESNQNCLVLSIPNPRQWPYVHVNVSPKSLQQPSSARLKMRCTSETWRMESHGPHGAHNSWVWVRMSLLLQAHQKSLWGQTKRLGLWEVDFLTFNANHSVNDGEVTMTTTASEQIKYSAFSYSPTFSPRLCSSHLQGSGLKLPKKTDIPQGLLWFLDRFWCWKFLLRKIILVDDCQVQADGLTMGWPSSDRSSFSETWVTLSPYPSPASRFLAWNLVPAD